MLYNYVGFNPHSHVKSYCAVLGASFTKIHFDVLKIICVLDGSIVVSDSFSDYLLKQNEIHIVNPTYPYFIHESQSNTDASTLLVVEIDMPHYTSFFPDFNKSVYFTCTVDPKNLLFEEYLTYLRFLMSKIYFLYNESNTQATTELDDAAKRLISFLLNHFDSYIFELDDVGNCKIVLNTNAKEPYDPSRIYRIIDYIYDHFDEDIKLEDIAELEYLSTSHISRYIKKTSGLSFSEHLSMARCEQAEKLLVTTSHSIDTIAEKVGFANRQHLNINFKRWFNLPPSQYKKRYLKRKIEAETQNDTVDYDKVMPILQNYLEQP